LAFHPYPQVIPQVFNPGGFGPPRRLTGASPCPWVDHSASGLGHATEDALFGLAFATAPPHGLTSPRAANSQAHSSKGTRSRPPHPVRRLAPTACRHTVSGTVSLPSRGTFHLSLTVLVRYRSPGSIQAWRVVPPDSHGISRAPCYLGTVPGVAAVSSTGVLPSAPALSHGLRLRRRFLTPRRTGRSDRDVPQPPPRNPCRVSHAPGLASSAFARHYSRNHCCLLLLWVLRCFTSPRSLHTPYVFRRG
jgi:hypothetical protein